MQIAMVLCQNVTIFTFILQKTVKEMCKDVVVYLQNDASALIGVHISTQVYLHVSILISKQVYL